MSHSIIWGGRGREMPMDLPVCIEEVVRRAAALLLKHFHHGGDFPHIGDGRFFEGQGRAVLAP